MTNDTDLQLAEPEEFAAPIQEERPKKPAKPQKYDLQYDGRKGYIFKLMIVDLLLSIITLGIYSFWGKTRMRKYLVGSHTLAGDRFEYTGTGGELFKGFLKVLPFLVVIMGMIIAAETYPVLAIIAYPVLFYVFGIGIYGAIRYRYSRTRWRGIRGYVDGSMIAYANLAFGRTILNAITLGFAIPSSDIAKHKYIMDNTYFGNIKAEYNGDSKVLFGAHIKSILVGFLCAGFGGVLVAAPIVLESFYETGGGINTTVNAVPGLISAISYLIGIWLMIIGFKAARNIYKAALLREKMRGLKIGNMRFMSTLGGMDLFKHKMMNGVILAFTVGFGYPIIVQRNAQLFARHTVIMGSLDEFDAQQAKDQGIKTGEGLDGALDIDVGFF